MLTLHVLSCILECAISLFDKTLAFVSVKVEIWGIMKNYSLDCKFVLKDGGSIIFQKCMMGTMSQPTSMHTLEAFIVTNHAHLRSCVTSITIYGLKWHNITGSSYDLGLSLSLRVSGLLYFAHGTRDKCMTLYFYPLVRVYLSICKSCKNIAVSPRTTPQWEQIVIWSELNILTKSL